MASPKTLGLLLAGGLARRMGGGDKPLRQLAGRTILERVIGRLDGQVDGLILNANGDPTRFAGFGLTVVSDAVAGFAGPLAGVLAGLDWAAEHRPDVDFIVSVAGDAPFLPRDLVIRLQVAQHETSAPIACAESAGRMHPVNALWSVALREDLRRAMLVEGLRKVGLYCQQHGAARVAWPTAPVDPFFNANLPEDLAEAERLLALHGEI